MSEGNAPSLTLWHNTTRDLRTGNIGPASGDVHWGAIDGPGLYFVVGQKAGGKSSVLNLLGKIQHASSDWKEIVTDGEAKAYLELAPLSAVFSVGPLGDPRAVITHADELPTIEALPSSIAALVDGGHLKDEKARARCRLRALLQYCPVDSTPERIGQLFRALEGRMWSADREQITIQGAWAGIMEALPRAPKRAEPFRYAEEIAVYVQEAPGRDGSLLKDHEILAELLNATGLCAERAFEYQQRQMSACAAVMDEVKAAASRQTGLPPERLATLLKAAHDKSTVAHERELRRLDLREIQVGRAARVAEIERRATIQATHGERPVVERELNALSAWLEEGSRCVEAEKVASGDLAVLAAAAAQDGERRAGATERAGIALARWEQFREDFPLAFSGHGDFVFNVDLSLFAERAPGLIKALEAALVYTEHDRRAELAAAEHAVEDAQEKSEESSAAIEEARTGLAAAKMAAERWDEVDALLQEEIEGPGEAEVTAASDAVDEAERAVQVAGHAGLYQAAAAELTNAVDLATGLETAGKDYRRAAKDSWSFLGWEVTEALALPWLQVDGQKIFLGYGDDGKLNSDPAVIAAARLRLEQTRAMDSGTLLPPARYLLEAIRAEPQVEWRDLDSSKRVSTCELHEACLGIMLSRRSSLSGILIVPWEVMAAFDEASLDAFAERVAEAGLVIISERPRRKGDREGLYLEKVGLPDLNGGEPISHQQDWEAARAGAGHEDAGAFEP